ncbi:MAG: hypothetical protein ACRCZW_11625 [Lactobacillaceae bacterium]
MNKKIMGIVGVIVIILVIIGYFTISGTTKNNLSGTTVSVPSNPTISQLIKNGSIVLQYTGKEDVYAVNVVKNNKVTTYDMNEQDGTSTMTLSKADKMTVKKLVKYFPRKHKAVDLKIKKFDDGTYGVQMYIDSSNNMQYIPIDNTVNAFKVHNHYYAGYISASTKSVVQVNSSKTAPKMEK